MFFSPNEASKNRIIAPGNVVHFFNLTKEVDRPDKLQEVLFGCHIPAAPVKIQFNKSYIRHHPFNSGHLVRSHSSLVLKKLVFYAFCCNSPATYYCQFVVSSVMGVLCFYCELDGAVLN